MVGSRASGRQHNDIPQYRMTTFWSSGEKMTDEKIYQGIAKLNEAAKYWRIAQDRFAMALASQSTVRSRGQPCPQEAIVSISTALEGSLSLLQTSSHTDPSLTFSDNFEPPAKDLFQRRS